MKNSSNLKIKNNSLSDKNKEINVIIENKSEKDINDKKWK